MNNFIKNEKILEEDYKSDDLLDFSKIIKDFKDRLDQISKNSIIGLIGEFGSGKSTMLYQLYKEQKEEDGEKWINFDAWKFPERKELWEGFVLEIARNLDEKLFNETRKKIDGEQHNDIKNLIKVIFRGANYFLPGASIGENLSSLFKTSPVKRIFEFQEILSQIINETKKDIYIIIEDIDRSGDRGIFFLETLKNFIKENKFNKKIIIVVPVGEKKRREDDFKDSYDKVLDYEFYFKPENINFSKFIKEIFNNKLISEDALFEYYLSYLLKLLIKDKNLTLRELKGVLRLANLEYKKLSEEERKDINFLVWIVFAHSGKFRERPFVLLNGNQKLKDDFGAKRFFIMLANNIEEDGLVRYKNDVPFFIAENNLMTPKFQENLSKEELSGYYLSNKYLKYFQ